MSDEGESLKGEEVKLCQVGGNVVEEAGVSLQPVALSCGAGAVDMASSGNE